MKNLFSIENAFIAVVALFSCAVISLIFDRCSAREKVFIGKVNQKQFTPAHTTIENKRRLSHFDSHHNAVYVYVPEEVFYPDKYEIFYECNGKEFSVKTSKRNFDSTREGESVSCSVLIGPLFGIKYQGSYDK